LFYQIPGNIISIVTIITIINRIYLIHNSPDVFLHELTFMNYSTFVNSWVLVALFIICQVQGDPKKAIHRNANNFYMCSTNYFIFGTR